MNNIELKNTAKRLVNAFNKGTFIAPLSNKFTKNTKTSKLLLEECQQLISSPVIGFKAGGTGKAALKQWGEKEPFYAPIFKKNLLKSNGSVKINKYTLGIELEVFFEIKKSFFSSDKKITEKNISSVINYVGPCIEIVG